MDNKQSIGFIKLSQLVGIGEVSTLGKLS